MADGSIKIAVEVDGKQVDATSRSLDNLESSGQDAGKGVKVTEDGMKGVNNESNKASISIKKVATALGLVALGAVAFRTLQASMDDAISRFDTLNTFPAVLQALGVSAEDSERSISNLSNGIEGLPTTLDEIATTAQRMYTSFGDMDKATDSALALNNAMLGSGSSAADAQRGTEQYLQALQRGKIDAMEWRTLQETMNVGLVKIAESFGFAGSSATNDLYAALKDGSITMDQFNDKLIEVGTGTGIMATLAKENSAGIATSLGNLRNAAARGLADIIKSFDNLSKEVTGNNIAENIDRMKVVITAAFKVMGNVIEGTAPIVKAFASGIGFLIDVARPLAPILIGIASAMAINTVISRTTAALQANATVTAVVTAAKKLYTLAVMENTTAQLTNTAVANIGAAAQKARSAALVAATAVELLFTRQITLAQFAMLAKAAAAKVLTTAMRILSGPVGWVTIGIGALVGAVVGVVQWFNKATEEGARLAEETETLTEASGSLSEAVENNGRAYEKSLESINASATANGELANKIEELAEKEHKSAAEKEILKSYIDELNGSVEGLNLAYGEEADMLNMSSEQLRARIDLMKEQETAQSAQERLTEILKEQAEVEAKLNETNELRAEWNNKLDEGSVKSREYKDAIAELDEQEKTLNGTLGDLAEQQVATEEQMTASMEAITEATKSSAEGQIIIFEELSEAQQTTVENMKSTWEDYKAAATDMFDTLNDEAEITVAEMTSNLEENQRIIGEWADNIATLAERGIDEGLLNTLREAGPESAGHVNALVNASDEELSTLSDAFAKGGDTATDALSKSLGIEESGVLDAVGHLVVGTEQALAQQIQSAGFDSIGNDVAEGLAGGIEAGTDGAVKASQNMADDTTNAAKAAFQTRSPSRVFKGIGGDVTDGLALGINQGTAKVIQAIQRMFRAVETGSRQSFSMITRNYNRAVMDIQRTLNKLPLITQRAMMNMLSRLRAGTTPQIALMRSLASRLTSPFNSTPAQFRLIGINAMAGLSSGLNAGRARVMATARGIANSVASTMRRALDIHSPSRVTMKIGKYAGEGLAKGISSSSKNVAAASKKLADETIKNLTVKYDTDKISPTKYVASLKSIQKNYKLTGDQSRKLQKEIYRANQAIKKQAEEYSKSIKKINDGVKSADNTYLNKVRSINNKLAKDIKNLQKDYNKRLADLTNSIYNQSSLFDKVEVKKADGSVLLNNLKDQNAQFKQFNADIAKIQQTGVSKKFVDELREMGVGAAAEINAIANMPRTMLDDYVKAWSEKHKLARNEATKQMEDEKKQMQQQIKSLTAAAKKELNQARTEWKANLSKLSEETRKLGDFKNSGKVLGKNTVQGLINGLRNMKGPLANEARALAKTIEKEIKKSLKIKSPSQLMRDDVGKMIPAGVAVGIKDNAKKVYAELNKLSEGMMRMSTPEVALGTSKMAYANPGNVSNVNTIKTDQSKSYSPQFVNHFTPAESTPSEAARKQKQQMERLALDWGFR